MAVVTKEVNEVSVEKTQKDDEIKIVALCMTINIICLFDIILMAVSPFGMFSILPCFLLPIYFLAVISICLLIVRFGKSFICI